VHNIAIRGNFDDCQKIVKTAFGDQSFLPEDRQLVAVNSINWARIMAQIVYYFYAALQVGAPHRPVSFSVPTGNFGDIYAGYLARGMGLPVDQLVIATNHNDILHRLISDNDYSLGELKASLSPSMDIMVSSNFERYLFDLFERDGEAVEKFVTSLSDKQQHLPEPLLQKAQSLFSSYAVDDDTTCQVIADVYQDTGFLLDPHTAIGVEAARRCNQNTSVPMIALATAHPVKFADAVTKAGLENPALPLHMQDLFDRPERYDVLDNDIAAVTEFMRTHLC
jgi:threonine synthase